MKYLITKSLLEAWQYQFDCFEGCEDDARESFMKTLLREPVEQTEAMLNGIEFENLVYKIASNNFIPEWVDEGVEPNSGEALGYARYPRWYTGAKKVAEIIKYAPVQIRAQRDITVDGIDFLLYGILDALKAGVIYDVKFSNKSFTSADLAGKYLSCSQHPAYLYLVPEAREFQYLVSDGEDVYVEAYTRQETPFIGDLISSFIRSIKADGLLEIYMKNWEAKEQ